MPQQQLKLAKLHQLVVDIKDLSLKIDDLKKKRELLLDEFKKVQGDSDKKLHVE